MLIIADILRNKGAHVQTITAITPLKEAIRMLAELRIGVLLVSADGRKIDGILSERDIVRGLAAESAEFDSHTVGDLMTTNVFTCAPGSTVVSVMDLMDRSQNLN